jgi:hypothetical protein
MTKGSFVLRVRACYGDPIDVDGLPTIANCTFELPVNSDDVVHDPIDGIDEVINAYETKFHCKIADKHVISECNETFDYFVFEPSCDDRQTSIDRCDALMHDILSWVKCSVQS